MHARLVEFLENAELSVFERYNIVSAGDLKDAARKLDMAGQGQNRDGSIVSQQSRSSA